LQSSNAALCNDCIDELPHLTSVCRRCSVPLNSGALCATCQLTPPSFRHCISAFHYQPPIDNLILRLKQDPFTAEINQLCAKLALRIVKRYRETQLPFPQTLIPLPLHWLKLARRGFNQSDIIGRHLARHLATEHNIEIELRSDLCKRITHGQAQHLLNAKKRLRSMKRHLPWNSVQYRTWTA